MALQCPYLWRRCLHMSAAALVLIQRRPAAHPLPWCPQVLDLLSMSASSLTVRSSSCSRCGRYLKCFPAFLVAEMDAQRVLLFLWAMTWFSCHTQPPSSCPLGGTRVADLRRCNSSALLLVCRVFSTNSITDQDSVLIARFLLTITVWHGDSLSFLNCTWCW